MQSLSGAGRSPGVAALNIIDNVIPFIPNEEEKVQTETSKILGSLEGDRIVSLDIPVSATCTRVNVRDGHTLSVSASGPGTLSYQWRKDGIDLAGQTNSFLIISSATPADIGNAAAFLASDDAEYITGTVLPVDGGFRFKDD